MKEMSVTHRRGDSFNHKAERSPARQDAYRLFRQNLETGKSKSLFMINVTEK